MDLHKIVRMVAESLLAALQSLKEKGEALVEHRISSK
jgi:hypothetical protein